MKKGAKILVGCLAAVLVVGSVTAACFHIPKDQKYRVETVSAAEKGKIKVGILSDCQIPEAEKNLSAKGYATVTEGAAHLWHTLRYFKDTGVDMIVLNGDVVNSAGDNAGYHVFNKILDDVFGEDRKDMPKIVFPMGNHEFYGFAAEQKYAKFTGLPMNTRTVLDGYSFIAVSNARPGLKELKFAKENDLSTDGTYTQERIAFLEKELAAAAKEDADKPIFVFMHMPVSDAIPGGHWSTAQYAQIYDILKQYPQAVLFTSHSHYCLQDERCITQKDFTMVNTGTSSYFDFDWVDPDKKEEGEENPYVGLTDADLVAGTKEVLKNKDYYIHPEYLGIECHTDVPYRNEVNNGLLLEIDTVQNQFTLTRLNLTLGVKFGEPFTMTDFKKESFTRTAEQIQDGRTPFFGEKQMQVKVEGDCAAVSFTAADQSVPVKYYLYVLEKPNGEKVPIRFFAHSFISGTDVLYTEQNTLRHLEKGSYRLSVYPINSYGKIGTVGPTADFSVK